MKRVGINRTVGAKDSHAERNVGEENEGGPWTRRRSGLLGAVHGFGATPSKIPLACFFEEIEELMLKFMANLKGPPVPKQS